MSSKARAQKYHAKRRARERFGIDLSYNDQIDMVEMIRNGQSRAVEKRSLRVTVHELEWDGQTLRVVYDKSRGTIVTVLPEAYDLDGAGMEENEISLPTSKL